MVSEQEPHGPPPERPDLLVTGGDVVTMNARREILAGGAVAVAGERVLAVGATSALRERWPGTPELSADGCVVTPGLVNAHQHHTGDPLARARIPDDLPPGASVGSWAIPLHRAHTAADDGLSALLTCVENLRNGVTTVVEAGTVAHPHRVADALRTAGIRGTVGTWGWDVPGAPFAAPRRGCWTGCAHWWRRIRRAAGSRAGSRSSGTGWPVTNCSPGRPTSHAPRVPR